MSHLGECAPFPSDHEYIMFMYSCLKIDWIEWVFSYSIANVKIKDE
jgi:hypothetical protein